MPCFRFETSAGLAGPNANIELANVREARIEAVRFLGELLRDDGAEFWEQDAVAMTVSDEAGLVLFRLDLSATAAPVTSGGR